MISAAFILISHVNCQQQTPQEIICFIEAIRKSHSILSTCEINHFSTGYLTGFHE